MAISKERKRIYDKEYRRINAEKIAAYQSEYWYAHKEEIGENFDKWYVLNFDKVKAQRKTYDIIHFDENQRRVKKWTKEHPEQTKEWRRAYSKAHPEIGRCHVRKRRAVARKAVNTLTRQEWEEIKLSYGNRCVYCGTKATSQDHIVPMARGGSHTADNVVPACGSCNSSKNAKPLLIWMYERNVNG